MRITKGRLRRLIREEFSIINETRPRHGLRSGHIIHLLDGSSGRAVFVTRNFILLQSGERVIPSQVDWPRTTGSARGSTRPVRSTPPAAVNVDPDGPGDDAAEIANMIEDGDLDDNLVIAISPWFSEDEAEARSFLSDVIALGLDAAIGRANLEPDTEYQVRRALTAGGATSTGGQVTAEELLPECVRMIIRESEWSLPPLEHEMLTSVNAPVPVTVLDYEPNPQGEGELARLRFAFGSGEPHEMTWDPELEYVSDFKATGDLLHKLGTGQRTEVQSEDIELLEDATGVHTEGISDAFEAGRAAMAAATLPVEGGRWLWQGVEQPGRFVVEGQMIITFAGTEDVDYESTTIVIWDTKEDRKWHWVPGSGPLTLAHGTPEEITVRDVEGWAPGWTPPRTPDEPRTPIQSNVVAMDKTGREFRLPMKRGS